MYLQDHEPNDPLAAFVGVRNLLLIYIVVAAVVVIGWRVVGTEPRRAVMQNSITYSTPERSAPVDKNVYRGGTSEGPGWAIRWAGPYMNGPTAIDAVRATLHHLTHLQNTNAASEANAKLIVHLTEAIEEFDGMEPSIGGELNDLIPKQEK